MISTAGALPAFTHFTAAVLKLPLHYNCLLMLGCTKANHPYRDQKVGGIVNLCLVFYFVFTSPTIHVFQLMLSVIPPTIHLLRSQVTPLTVCSWIPLQKTALGCTPWQKTSDSSKSLTEAVLSWIAFLNWSIRWEDGNTAVILYRYGHILNFYFVSSHFSHLSPLHLQIIQPIPPPPVSRSSALAIQSPHPSPSLNSPAPNTSAQVNCHMNG